MTKEEQELLSLVRSLMKEYVVPSLWAIEGSGYPDIKEFKDMQDKFTREWYRLDHKLKGKECKGTYCCNQEE
jgi:hypothetical protein